MLVAAVDKAELQPSRGELAELGSPCHIVLESRAHFYPKGPGSSDQPRLLLGRGLFESRQPSSHKFVAPNVASC